MKYKTQIKNDRFNSIVYEGILTMEEITDYLKRLDNPINDIQYTITIKSINE